VSTLTITLLLQQKVLKEKEGPGIARFSHIVVNSSRLTQTPF